MIVSYSQERLSVRNVILSTAGLIISSKVFVPLYPVPITLQMLAVYYLGLVLTPKESFSALLGWIALGAAGLPVFVSSIGGLNGPTVGYLIGMLLGSPLMGILLRRKASPVLACIICYIVVHIFGCLWLRAYVNWHDVFVFGVVPFIIPEFLKISVAISITNLMKRKDQTL